jgi:type VI secretion system protein VasD
VKSIAVSNLVLLVLVGCAKPEPPKAPEKCPPQTLSLSFLASPRINPSPDGQARPLVVRVYQLKGDGRLLNATFEQVWQDDKTTLADDVVKMQEVEVYPARRIDISIERPETVNHIAAVALFRAPKSRAWVSAVDLPPLPEAGKCGAAACVDNDEDCLNMSVQHPKFAFWIDETKIEDGSEHTEDFPAEGKAGAP